MSNFCFQKPSLLPRPLSNALERPKTLPPAPPVTAAKPASAQVESLTQAGDVEHVESPEKLSLKARLKLFEKEIEQQGSAPAPKPEKKFSFLNADEIAKMKEEEGKSLSLLNIF